MVADSTFIIKYLQRTYPAAGKKLSDEEAAICTVVHHFMEKYILFGMFYFRWIQPMVSLACTQFTREPPSSPLQYPLLIAKRLCSDGSRTAYLHACAGCPAMKAVLRSALLLHPRAGSG